MVTGRSSGSSREERMRLFLAGGLLAAVLAILLTGAILQADRARIPDGGEPAAPAPSEPSGSSAGRAGASEEQPVSERSRVEPETDRPSSLERRAASDTDRMRSAPRGWTLQLMVACDPDNAEALLRQAGGSTDLYLLPVTLNGNPCFRACWGRYPTRESALEARTLPNALRARLDDPLQPRPVADVLP